jgi:hypothetical protein
VIVSFWRSAASALPFGRAASDSISAVSNRLKSEAATFAPRSTRPINALMILFERATSASQSQCQGEDVEPGSLIGVFLLGATDSDTVMV